MKYHEKCHVMIPRLPHISKLNIYYLLVSSINRMVNGSRTDGVRVVWVSLLVALVTEEEGPGWEG